MKIAIISGGSIQREFASGFLKSEAPDRLIAADSGLDFCLQEGLLPDLILGDFDSVSEGAAERFCLREMTPGSTAVQRDAKTGKQVTVTRFRAEKDATDTELAAEAAAEAGADEIILLGATGSRLDHVLGNLSLLYRMKKRGIRTFIVDECCRIHMPLSNTAVLRKKEQFGTFVSVLPYGGPVTGLTLEGFAYPLEGRTVSPGEESLCVSNQIRADEARVSFSEGTVILIESRDSA